MSTTFWHLCPDIIIEICRYFTVNELFCSFYPDVLPYLFEILTESHNNLHFCLTNDDLLTGQLLSLININQIKSLKKSSNNIPIQLFNSIQTLTLDNIPSMNHSIIEASKLPFLQRLIIHSSNNSNRSFEPLFQCICTNLSIKYLKLNLNNPNILTVKYHSGSSSTIKQLIINASCSLSTINNLLTSLPCLHILQIRTIMDSSVTNVGYVSTLISSKHLSLKILDIVWYHPSIDSLVKLLTKFPNLEQYRMSGIINSKELNGKLWYKLITETCLNLKQMIINMQMWTNIEAEEIEINFHQDTFFKRLGFKLFQNKNEQQLLTFVGNFKRSIQ